jgi:DNA-binding NtrC family response regulator
MKKKTGKLLIVDDHRGILKALVQLLEPEFEMVHTANNPNLIPKFIESESYDVILLDMNFSAGINTGNEGLYWMRTILKYDSSIAIIMITAYGEVDLAVKAMKEGATDFVLKPWDNDKLIATLKAAVKLHQSKLEINSLRNKQKHLSEVVDKHYNRLIGSSKPMQKIISTIEKVAGTDANVLLLGENGTGKELLAREIHKKSDRANEVFVSVDMGALSHSLFESEMFGHQKGSFTDAKEDRVGRLETASGGTLFLDEIGNLSLEMQAKLLTVLQNRQIIRLGSNKAVSIDVRLICATNKNLKQMIAERQFREDLFYRINTIEIEIPPLRDRTEDIEPIADYFLKQYSKKYKKALLKISSSALKKLKKYHWQGNIRELQHKIEKAVIMCESSLLQAEDFFVSESPVKSLKKPQKFAEIEKQAIETALTNNNGSVAKAAQELGLARQTLYNKMLKYEL